ncbi:MAG: helix-turn-helix transcriptional regulator [Gammaproteobacteria bacterium]|jgi:AraC-like DNA-binding protein|nr:helix-turn-helix transcriptional regulator [Gammaproteobacteria bacterium]MBT4493405.1 helix-turn-helix transcriptional regulator [Gammaproteobacteria bacterium]MBT7369932.1 helix-turn-helix transcriptional regulator [Gammaproteobacteria bacterium]
METLHYIFRLLAFSQVLFITSYIVLHERNRAGWLAALSLAGFGCYLLQPMVHLAGSANSLYLLDFIGSSIPAFLWLFARTIFVDDRRVPWRFWILWLVYMVLWASGYGLGHDWGRSGDVLFELIPQLIKLGLVVHVVIMAMEGRANDLINRRLKLRVPVAIGAGSLTSAVILVEIWAGGDTPMLVELFGSVSMFFITQIAGLYLFSLRSELSLGAVAAQQEQQETVEETDIIPVIEQLMQEQRFYAVHGVTLGDLATKVARPEYRLRTVINHQMGYRNFNQFLNHYRIAEANERLLSERSLPILTIALDVGFKSLSSFNQSFKAVNGCTPTEFRAKSLTDS